jgi:sugar/nucleoside kinase (ribokinase family)
MAARAPVLCAGAAHWDIIARTSAQLPPGADVPGRVTRRPGGVALNVALALAAIGRPVALIAAIGRDLPGGDLSALIVEAGIDAAGVYHHDGATDCYVAIEDRRGALHAAVADTTGLERAGLALLGPQHDRRLRCPWHGQIVIDGNLPGPILHALMTDSATTDAPLALVPASPRKAAWLAPLVGLRPLTVYSNRLEAEALCGRPFADSRAAAEALVARGAAEAVVTDGGAAASAAWHGDCLTRPPPAVPARSVTGAGDAFVAAHLAARADGLGREAALGAALAASARHIAREVS